MKDFLKKLSIAVLVALLVFILNNIYWLNKVVGSYYVAFGNITDGFSKGVVNLDYGYEFQIMKNTETVGIDGRKYYEICVVERTPQEKNRALDNAAKIESIK